MIHYTFFNSPVGRISIAKSERGICRIGLPGESEDSFLAWHRKYFPGENVVKSGPALSDAVEELMRYLAGELRVFSLALDLRTSLFRQKVLEEVRTIPYGETASYKEIAERMGKPGAARAVGGANAHNPLPIVIPCHRVVAHDGTLGGYGGGLNLKEHLLQLEGAP
ncbi:MAG: methylated-DNA--[protein]-cysteine S-methyltransferase [Candidatus Neomarinimicrobiota bacterium]